MDVEARKSYRFGFILREPDLRRIVDTIGEQVRKLTHDGEPITRFMLKFQNGVVANNLSLDEVLAQENSGAGKILRLSYMCGVAPNDDTKPFVALELVNVDEYDEPGYVSVRFHVFGQDRDWVFVTSSLLEERIERIRRWAPNQLAFSERGNVITRVGFELVLFGFVGLLSSAFVTFGSPTTQYERTVQTLAEKWKTGKLTDPVAALIAIEQAKVADRRAGPAAYFPLRFFGGIFAAFAAVLLAAAFLFRYYPVYNFCWGEYLEWFNKREAGRKFWLTVVLAGFVISLVASVVANRLN
ncbi:MAG: hypothetical protein JO231_21335 [Acidobacteria bacterium]|nr:hypothetical protein [Acidobacteriota bacterium]